MNKDGLTGYFNLSDYLINPSKFAEINIDDIKDYIIIYGITQNYNLIDLNNINKDLSKILNEIHTNRIKKIQEYIKIEDSIFDKGIFANDIIYRMQDKPIEGNILYNSTSWSLYPVEWFCNKKECYLYITKIPRNLKVIYLENNSKDEELDKFQEFNFYEFEFIIPRNLSFEIIKTAKTKIINDRFIDKNNEMSFKYKTINVIWIKIKKKIKNIEFPKINELKLIVPI